MLDASHLTRTRGAKGLGNGGSAWVVWRNLTASRVMREGIGWDMEHGPGS